MENANGVIQKLERELGMQLSQMVKEVLETALVNSALQAIYSADAVSAHVARERTLPNPCGSPAGGMEIEGTRPPAGFLKHERNGCPTRPPPAIAWRVALAWSIWRVTQGGCGWPTC